MTLRVTLYFLNVLQSTVPGYPRGGVSGAQTEPKTSIGNCPNVTNLCTCFLWPWLDRFSNGNGIRYVLPVLWMTSRFHVMKRIVPNQRLCIVSSSSPDGSTGGKVCRLRLHLLSIAHNGSIETRSQLAILQGNVLLSDFILGSLRNDYVVFFLVDN